MNCNPLVWLLTSWLEKHPGVFWEIIHPSGSLNISQIPRLHQCLCRRDGLGSLSEQLVGTSEVILRVSCGLSVGCGGIVGSGGYLGVCAPHWSHRAELCSAWQGGRLVQAQLTPESSPDIT